MWKHSSLCCWIVCIPLFCSVVLSRTSTNNISRWKIWRKMLPDQQWHQRRLSLGAAALCCSSVGCPLLLALLRRKDKPGRVKWNLLVENKQDRKYWGTRSRVLLTLYSEGLQCCSSDLFKQPTNSTAAGGEDLSCMDAWKHGTRFCKTLLEKKGTDEQSFVSPKNCKLFLKIEWPQWSTGWLTGRTSVADKVQCQSSPAETADHEEVKQWPGYADELSTNTQTHTHTHTHMGKRTAARVRPHFHI